ncbi:putative solute carrier family 15 member 4-like [Apostichopus japonicus]|uniref:Putative solute carrier family 15 member 4-like n=1 Tax=Stichopus japonicus TaxID=307972 RepID=A0A2G8KCG0_STIJA|nr:putative solute carrier family 15 member 4-like [Apostichopus japonicus]
MSCFCILVVVALERLAFYGITCNLVMFLNADPYTWQALTGAASTIFVFFSLSFLSSLVFGVLADSLFGRYSTLVLSLVLFIFGSILMCLLGWLTTHNDDYVKFCTSTGANESSPVDEGDVPNTQCTSMVFVALFLIALGAGSIRSNLSPFGAEQVKDGGPDVMHTFFNWFYWAINVGSLISYFLVAYIQQNINFFYGFVIPAASVSVCLLVFIFGKIWFITRKPTAVSYGTLRG